MCKACPEHTKIQCVQNTLDATLHNQVVDHYLADLHRALDGV